MSGYNHVPVQQSYPFAVLPGSVPIYPTPPPELYHKPPPSDFEGPAFLGAVDTNKGTELNLSSVVLRADNTNTMAIHYRKTSEYTEEMNNILNSIERIDISQQFIEGIYFLVGGRNCSAWVSSLIIYQRFPQLVIDHYEKKLFPSLRRPTISSPQKLSNTSRNSQMSSHTNRSLNSNYGTTPYRNYSYPSMGTNSSNQIVPNTQTVSNNNPSYSEPLPLLVEKSLATVEIPEPDSPYDPEHAMDLESSDDSDHNKMYTNFSTQPLSNHSDGLPASHINKTITPENINQEENPIQTTEIPTYFSMSVENEEMREPQQLSPIENSISLPNGNYSLENENHLENEKVKSPILSQQNELSNDNVAPIAEQIFQNPSGSNIQQAEQIIQSSSRSNIHQTEQIIQSSSRSNIHEEIECVSSVGKENDDEIQSTPLPQEHSDLSIILNSNTVNQVEEPENVSIMDNVQQNCLTDIVSKTMSENIQSPNLLHQDKQDTNTSKMETDAQHFPSVEEMETDIQQFSNIKEIDIDTDSNLTNTREMENDTPKFQVSREMENDTPKFTNGQEREHSEPSPKLSYPSPDRQEIQSPEVIRTPQPSNGHKPVPEFISKIYSSPPTYTYNKEASLLVFPTIEKPTFETRQQKFKEEFQKIQNHFTKSSEALFAIHSEHIIEYRKSLQQQQVNLLIPHFNNNH